MTFNIHLKDDIVLYFGPYLLILMQKVIVKYLIVKNSLVNKIFVNIL